MQAYYAARAAEYDRTYLRPERQTDLRAIELWLAALYAEQRVLEIACGTGYWTQFIAVAAAHVLAIDTSPEVLSIARGRVPADKAEFLVGDAYDPPEHRDGFDGAFAGFWFSHVPMARRREFLVRLNRVLKPGAKVVLLDNLYVEGSSSPIAGQDAQGNTYQIRVLSDGSEHRVLKNFPTHEQLCAAAHGLTKRASFKRWQYFWAFEYLTAQQ